MKINVGTSQLIVDASVAAKWGMFQISAKMC